MPPTRSRATGFAVAIALLLAIGGPALPAAAVDSPDDAVDQLLDAIERRDLEAVDALVCEAEREAAGEMLDPAAAMGISTESLAEALSVRVEDRAFELVDEEGDTATVAVSGTASMDIGDADPEALALELLAAGGGEGASEEELAWMVPMMAMVFTQSSPLDLELTLVREDGEWVVCGGFDQPTEEPDYGFAPAVSDEGLCGLVHPDELSALGELQYDSSSGFANFCNYSNSDYENYLSTSVTIEYDTDATYYAEAFGADQQLEVAGLPAWASGPEAFGQDLLTQAGDDLVLVNVALPENAPDGVAWLDQARLVTELFLPRVDEARELIMGPAPPPTPEVSLCETLPVEELNELTGLGFDAASGSSTSCYYEQLDGEPGYHVASFTLVDMPMAEYAGFLPGLEETTVGEFAAAVMEGLLLIDLPGGRQILQVTALIDGSDDSAALSSEELQRLIAERVAPAIEPAEPAADDAIDAAMESTLCTSISLEALNERTGLGFDDSFGDATTCELMSNDGEPGYHYAIALVSEANLTAYGSLLESEEDSVAGQPALIGDQWVAVALPDGTRVLDVAVGLDESDVSLTSSATEIAIAIAEEFVPELADS